MTSKIIVHCNGNYRVPVSKVGVEGKTYVGPGENVEQEFLLTDGVEYHVGAEEYLGEAVQQDQASASEQ
jgi:hypothetical protein